MDTLWKTKTQGLIHQDAFSDWQDSSDRRGYTLFTNLLYYIVSERLQKYDRFKVTDKKLDSLRSSIEKTFYDSKTGLYRTHVDLPNISLDGNLLILDLGYLDGFPVRKLAVYNALRRHQLKGVNGMPGFNTYPDYPDKWISWTAKSIGLRHYHDQLYWSWLMGLSAKVALQMGDVQTADRIFSTMQILARRDGAVTEIYNNQSGFSVVEGAFYRAEAPFSWGAAFVLDALK